MSVSSPVFRSSLDPRAAATRSSIWCGINMWSKGCRGRLPSSRASGAPQPPRCCRSLSPPLSLPLSWPLLEDSCGRRGGEGRGYAARKVEKMGCPFMCPLRFTPSPPLRVDDTLSPKSFFLCSLPLEEEEVEVEEEEEVWLVREWLSRGGWCEVRLSGMPTNMFLPSKACW